MPTENRSSNTGAPFRREDRYIVIKRSDLKKVPANYRAALVDPMLSLLSHLPRRECLVIEADWPEFEPAWQAIEARVTGALASCTWAYNDDSFAWDTACKESFLLMDDGPKENCMKFCCYCSKPIIQAQHESES